MNERIYYSREAELRAQRDRLTLAVMVAGLGIGIGALLALLLAPRPGDKTRKQIVETLAEAGSHGREVAGQVFKTVRDGASKLQEEVSERVNHAVNS